MARPTGLIATKGIELLTWGTPNGWKASILLEELKDLYGLSYTTNSVDISTNVQKEPWFTTSANPNGRIPAIVDHDNNGLNVFEGSAILSYLSRRYDPDNRLSFPADSDDYTRAESWIGWQHGGVGPMQGQANHFARAAKETIPYGIQRYVGETERLYGVLDAHLSDKEYVVGGKYSIADIALVGWVNASVALGMPLKTQFPNVYSWLERLFERPAVKRGFNVPSPLSLNAVEGVKDEETKQKLADVKKMIDEAKEQYNYKYASP